MTRRHTRATAAGIAASALRNMTAILMFADPEEAADLLADVFATGGVLDELRAVLTNTHDLIRDEVPADRWSEDHPGYVLFHLLADTTEHLGKQAQELRGAAQILRDLPGPFPPAAPAPPPAPLPAPVTQIEPGETARTRPAAAPIALSPAATPPPAASASPRTTR